MLRKLILPAAVVVVILLLAACAGPQGPAGPAGPTGAKGDTGAAGPKGDAGAAGIAGSDYVTSAKCGECHKELYDTFRKSGHPWKLNKVVGGKAPEYPFTKLPALPEGYTWNDISYVIGGFNWKTRFMNKDGFIITDKPGASGDAKYLNQYNFANQIVGKDAGWVGYNPGVKELKYDCGPCHTTGYKLTGNQDNMKGVVGTWAEPGIQCEACHGPGSSHAKNPYGVEMKVDRSPELCGTCHRRGAVEKVDAKDGFIEHHEQYEELFQSKHITLDCVVCHNPHQGVVQLRNAKQPTTRTTCANCHFKEVKAQKVEKHAGLQCESCHMPRIAKTAWGDAKKFTGDIRVHLMAIDTSLTSQFSADGKVANSQIALDFACKSCHIPGGAMEKKDDLLKETANGYHTAKK